jgi:hypothetical protein
VATTPTTIVEGFSVSHAAILDGLTPAGELADIYGIREGTLDVDTDSYDNTGDDQVLSTWAWINFATVSIKAGYIPFNVIALLSGSTLVSTGAAATTAYSLPLWNLKSMNQAARPVLIRVPSKDSAGTPRLFDIVLYKVQFNPITFDGPTYKDGMALNYGGKALISAADETGVALADKAVGRLVSSPPAP